MWYSIVVFLFLKQKQFFSVKKTTTPEKTKVNSNSHFAGHSGKCTSR